LKLLVLDVEGTVFKAGIRLPGTSIDSTIWQGIANTLGPDAVAAEVRTHEKWHAGEYKSYLDWMQDTIRIHQHHGLTESTFRALIQSAEYSDGVRDALARISRTHYQIVLVSGGFRELAARAQRDLQVIHAFAACEYFFGPDGRIDGFNLLPCDFAGKLDFIQLMLREYGIASDGWIYVGDGANDVPIAKAAPLSIGYRAHPALRSVCSHTIESFAELQPIMASAA
jgi:phosphoserine phosphatase